MTTLRQSAKLAVNTCLNEPVRWCSRGDSFLVRKSFPEGEWVNNVNTTHVVVGRGKSLGKQNDGEQNLKTSL